MSLYRELRLYARQALLTAFGVCSIVYFAYFGISGDRGLFAWQALQQQVADAKAQLAEVQGERAALEGRVKLLYPESLDADMLDESARRLLNYGLSDEAVVLDSDAEASALKSPALQSPAKRGEAPQNKH